MKTKACETIFLLLSAWFLAGCAGLPLAERQANATTEVSERWSRDQKERLETVIKAIRQNGQGSSVEWSVDSSESGNGDQSLLGGLENSIPGGLKLVYFGVGLVAVFFAVRLIINSSASAKAVAKAADEAIAKQVRKIEGRLTGAANDKERSDLLALLTDLERERGKLKT